LIVALVVGLAVVSVAAASASRRETVTLTATFNVGYQAATNLLISNFERVYPDIKIQPTYLPNGVLQTTLLTQFQAGNAPDLIWMVPGTSDVISPVPLAKAGRLVDLSGSPWVSRIKPIKDGVTYKGKVYGWPAGFTPVAVWYNDALFKQLGLKVPVNFGQLLTMCKKVSAAGKVPFAFGMGAGAAGIDISFLVGRVGQYVYKGDPTWTAKRTSNKVSFASSASWRRLLQSYVDMNTAGCFPPHPEGVSNAQLFSMMGSGQAVMMASNSALIAGLKLANPNLGLKVFPLPADKQANTVVTLFTAPVYGINSASHHVAEAKKFIDFLGRAKQNSLFNQVGNQIAPFDATKGKVPDWATPLKSYFQSGKTIQDPTAEWTNPALRNLTLIPDITGLFTGQKSVDDILKDLDAGWVAPK
jgi:raffinose/stachyose/melibiose transport system substrate-binding protein